MHNVTLCIDLKLEKQLIPKSTVIVYCNVTRVLHLGSYASDSVAEHCVISRTGITQEPLYATEHCVIS
jgi:hypothetical protein